MDPSAAKGFVMSFQTQIPVELRIIETADQLGTIENIDLKLFIKGPKNDPKEIKIELSSEVDLFFHYTHIRNVDNFRDLQRKHKLLIKLTEYPALMDNLLKNVINSPTQYLAVFYMDRNGAGRFDIVQNISYKFLELVSCEFQISADELVRKSIIYRYTIQKNMMNEIEQQILALEELLRHRAPGVLQTFKKQAKLSTSSTNLSQIR